MTNAHSHQTPNAGFTLVEVLVAMLVISIGLLVLATLQLNSLRNNASAMERSQATMYAYDIIDRMRANKDAAVAGNYTTSLGTAPGNKTCTSSACNAADLASYDVALWKCSIGKWNDNANCTAIGITGPLPDGDGSVSLNGTTVTVTVQWSEKRSESTAAAKLTSLSVSTQL